MSQLDDARYIILGTFRKNGVRVDTPIWAAPRGGKLYAFTEADSGKVKRLRNSTRTRVARCGARGKLLGDWADARAQIVQDAAMIETAYQALHEKYGWQMKLTDLVSRLTGRYEKRAILEIEVLEQRS